MASLSLYSVFVVLIVVQYLAAAPIDAPPAEPAKANKFKQKSPKYQGDISNVPKNYKKNRNAIISNKWPKGVIPYVSTLSAAREPLLQSVINRIQNSTCLRIVPRTNQTSYVRVTSSDDGCYSSVGVAGGVQDLNFQDNSEGSCMFFEIVLHEWLHAIGLFHEQSRYDRNNYITLQLKNINQEDMIQFDIASSAITSFYNTSYDFDSVMHYDQYAFSNNGQPTMIINSNVPDAAKLQNKLGTVLDASPTDLLKVNRMYNCPGYTTEQTVSPAPASSKI